MVGFNAALNLIKYHNEKDEEGFKKEALKLAESFKGADDEVMNYIKSFYSVVPARSPQEMKKEMVKDQWSQAVKITNLVTKIEALNDLSFDVEHKFTGDAIDAELVSDIETLLKDKLEKKKKQLDSIFREIKRGVL